MPPRLPKSSPDAILCVPSIPRQRLEQDTLTPILSSAMSRHGAILSLVVMRGREGSGHLEEMTICLAVQCFFSVEACGMVLQNLSRSVCFQTSITVCPCVCGKCIAGGDAYLHTRIQERPVIHNHYLPPVSRKRTCTLTLP